MPSVSNGPSVLRLLCFLQRIETTDGHGSTLIGVSRIGGYLGLSVVTVVFLCVLSVLCVRIVLTYAATGNHCEKT